MCSTLREPIMSEQYNVEELPDVDQWEIKRGRCPWCQGSLVDNGVLDECIDCGDLFVGTLTIKD